MSWLLGLVGVVLLSVLADVLLPSGQTNKYIKGIFSLLVILTLITPIIKLKNADFNISDIIGGDEIAIDNDFISDVSDRELTALESRIEKELNNRGINTKKVVLTISDGNINSITSVSVRISEIDNADTVKMVVSEMLSISEDIVEVYE